jgi:predicted metal-binding membrane protein
MWVAMMVAMMLPSLVPMLWRYRQAVGRLAGAMDLRVLALVRAATTAERLAPSDARVVRAIGDVVVAAGLVLLARAVGLGGQGL